MTEQTQMQVSYFNFFRPASGEKYTRFEALYDLISRATSTPYLYCRHGREREIQKGQFVSTILELATAWNWHRPVVKSFIGELQSLNILQYEKYYSSTVFTISTSQEIEFPLATMDNFVAAFFAQFEQLILCKNSVQNLCNFCGKNRVSFCGKNEPTNSFVFKDFQKTHFISSLTFSMLATLAKQSAIRLAESSQGEHANVSTMDEQTLFQLLTKYRDTYSKLSSESNFSKMQDILQQLNPHIKELFQPFIQNADDPAEKTAEDNFSPSRDFFASVQSNPQPLHQNGSDGQKNGLSGEKKQLAASHKKNF